MGKKRKRMTKSHHSFPILKPAKVEFTGHTPSKSTKSHPIVHAEGLYEMKENESCQSMETVNDILLNSSSMNFNRQPMHSCKSNLSNATSDFARDLPMEIYHFARKWRYYRPLKRLFAAWKYRARQQRKRQLNHCPTTKTIDRFEHRSRTNQEAMDKLGLRNGNGVKSKKKRMKKKRSKKKKKSDKLRKI